MIAFRGGFHGRTHGSDALTSSTVKYRAHFEPLMGGVQHVPYPSPLKMGGPDAALATTLAAIDEVFATTAAPDDVAAFVVEPVLGEGGYVVPPDGFLAALREVADRHGILLAVDEVQSVTPARGVLRHRVDRCNADIVIMAKGIAPACRCRHPRRTPLLDRLEPGRTAAPTAGNAVACAAALATLDVIDDEGLAERAHRLGGRLLDGLRDRVGGTNRSGRCAVAA